MDINDTIYNIHVFGDSHSQLYGSPYLSNYICNVYDVGEITMDRVGKENLTTDKLKELMRGEYSKFIFQCLYCKTYKRIDQ
jgi:hypothetical protein